MNYISFIIINDKNADIVNLKLTQILFIYKHIDNKLKHNLFYFMN